MGEKLVLENFTSGVFSFGKKKGVFFFQFSQGDVDHNVLYSEGGKEE